MRICRWLLDPTIEVSRLFFVTFFLLWLSVVGMLLTGCTPPTKLERGKPVASPASHTAMCADPERWEKWVCTNEKPE